MADTSFAAKFTGLKETGPEEAHEWRDGFTGDNAGGSSPFCLSLCSRDGREMEGPSMEMFQWHYWLDDAGPVQRLVLLFMVGAAYIEGEDMKRRVKALFQEGKLKRIQEHTAVEMEAIRRYNHDRKPEDREPVVIRIIVVPDIQTRLKSDASLAPIAALIKGNRAPELTMLENMNDEQLRTVTARCHELLKKQDEVTAVAAGA